MNEVLRFANEFDTRHGDFVRVDQWLVFHDGAKRDVHPMGLSMEPPEDELERFQNMEVYRREKLRRALEAFNKLRQEIVLATDTCRINGYEPPCSAEEAKAKLEGLLTKIRLWQRKVKLIEKMIADTPRMQSRSAYQEGKAYNRTLCEEVIAAIQGIEI